MTVSATMTHDRIEQHTAFLNTLNRLDGRTAVVTGANSGLGLETACGLASLGAKIILASRSEDRNLAALALLQERVPEATTAETMQLDLASLASIERFANDLRGRLSTLDLLVNNAGVMAPPVRGETADGFEMQFGVNHLGHFALTGRLKPLLEASATGGVVVAVASLAAWKARIRFDDLQSRYRYSPFDAYRQSKLSNLLFGQELARRSRAARWNLHGRIAHPGWARTQLVVNGLAVERKLRRHGSWRRAPIWPSAGSDNPPPVERNPFSTPQRHSWLMTDAIMVRAAQESAQGKPSSPSCRRPHRIPRLPVVYGRFPNV